MSLRESIRDGTRWLVTGSAGMQVINFLFGGLAGSLANIAMLNLVVRQSYRLAFDIKTARRFGSYGFRFISVDILDYIFNQTGNILTQGACGHILGLPDPWVVATLFTRD